jgi:hypothetical protein
MGILKGCKQREKFSGPSGVLCPIRSKELHTAGVETAVLRGWAARI